MSRPSVDTVPYLFVYEIGPSRGKLLRYGVVVTTGTQGLSNRCAAALDQVRWTMYVEPGGMTLASSLNSHMSATSPSVTSVQTMSASSSWVYADAVSGNGSVAASTSSWLMSMVRSCRSVTAGPSNMGQAQETA